MNRTYPMLGMLLLLGLHATPSYSQNDDFVKQFQQARQGMLDEYNKFRNTVLTDYDKYMQGVWKEYKKFKGDVRSQVPKPKTPPAYTQPKQPEKPVTVKPKMPVSPIVIPEGGFGNLVKRPDLGQVPALPTDPLAKVPTVPTTPETPAVPETPKKPNDPKAPTVRPDIEPVNKPKLPEVKPDIPDIEYTGSGIEIPLMPAVAAIPVMPALPNIAHVNVPASKQSIDVNFYGEPLQMQKATQLASMSISTTDDVANYWKLLKKSDLKDVTQAFATESRKMGLSDWGSAMLVEKYIQEAMPKASQNERIIAAQYVLANCGYNVRLALCGKSVVMLVPYAEHVFEKSYLNIDGKRYYIYPNVEDDGSFRSCELPKGAELGKDMELRFTGKLSIGDETKPFSYNAAGITLQGEVPTGYMGLLDEYPIIDIPTVASSVVDKKLRDNVVEQIKAQVQGLSEQDAANRILHFIQKGFPYATDDEQFKCEKYFYFEESLYYPKNDCEDRAIFYAYLVHEILGLDVHLIQFPGHECTAVAFHEPVENGTSYQYKGQTYYICDPTYIGARIGKCMPQYAKESPQIEVWY